jgi:hypothetical protein
MLGAKQPLDVVLFSGVSITIRISLMLAMQLYGVV